MAVATASVTGTTPSSAPPTPSINMNLGSAGGGTGTGLTPGSNTNNNNNNNNNNNGSGGASCTIQSLLQTAKKLADRLNEHENNVEHIISETEQLNKHIVSMRTYKDEVEVINENNRYKPRSQLIRGIQYENRQIRSLQKENEELKLALEEHQNAMELIMSKYREHVSMLSEYAKLDFTSLNNPYQAELEQKNAKILEMVAVMQQVVRLDENSAFTSEKRIAQLEYENRTLRELLFVSKQFQSLIRLVSSNPHALSASLTAAGVTLPPPNQSNAPQSDESSTKSSDDDNTNQSSPNSSSCMIFDYPSRTVKKRPSLGLNSSNSNSSLFSSDSTGVTSTMGGFTNEPCGSPLEGSTGASNVNGLPAPSDIKTSGLDSQKFTHAATAHPLVNGDVNVPIAEDVKIGLPNGVAANNGTDSRKSSSGGNGKLTHASGLEDSGEVLQNGVERQQTQLTKSRYGSETDIISDTDSDSSSNASTMTLTPCTSDRENEDEDEPHCDMPPMESLLIASSGSAATAGAQSTTKPSTNCIPNGCIPSEFIPQDYNSHGLIPPQSNNPSSTVNPDIESATLHNGVP